MPYGRTYNHARAAAITLTTLTTLGLGLATASPASAAPGTDDIGTAQARFDRLSQKAAAAHKRHDLAKASLDGASSRLGRLNKGIRHERHVIESLQAQVASKVVGEYGAAGASVPTTAATALSKDSEVMLTNVTSVSEDTGERGDALARSNEQLAQLKQRRAAVSDQVTLLRDQEKPLRARQAQVDAHAAQARAVLAGLQAQAESARKKAAAEKMARLGGPVLAYAKAQVGKAYVFGAAGPNAFDCSGLTMMAWSQSGVSLPHSSSAQYSSGPHISESELQPGDLVFYYSPISHVGLYIGGGKIVNALNPGAGVRISGLHDMPYVGAVRPG